MTTLGRYEILDKLGMGSMGTVYRARDTVLDREVALKTIRTGAEIEPELRERFYREARACARLQHPGIIAVYDLGEVDRTAFIAMELLVGFDFRKLIDQRVESPLGTKIEAMVQVCEALAHAHRHGIIHRDIKPSNLFLTEGNRAKVLDFGIARLPTSHLTVAGKILGTPNYMAPEQILSKPSDTRSDLFSAAVVFFEYLVYVHPFHSSLIPQRVVECEPDSLFDHDSHLPIILDKIFVRALAKDPAKRYRTGDEFANDLRILLDAIRQNASPSFSRLELPSDRELRSSPDVEPVRQTDPSLLIPPPPGEDPHEWRLSEVLRLIPEFEGAVDRRDVSAARRVFAHLEAIESVDPRFGSALELCRSRLAGLEPSKSAPAELVDRPPTVPYPQPPRGPGQRTEERRSAGPATDPATTPKICAQCSASNRSAAIYCIVCGASFPAVGSQAARVRGRVEMDVTLLGSQPEGVGAVGESSLPRPVNVGAPRSEYEPVVTLPPIGAPDVKVPDEPRSPAREWTRRKQQIALFCAGAFLIMLVAGAVTWALWPPRVELAVATAVIAVPRATLYAHAEGDSRITFLSKDQRVNILRIPRGQGPERIPAQFVSPKKTTAPGYIRVEDLDREGWDSPDPTKKLRLIRMFHSGEAGDDAHIQAEIAALQRFIDQFPSAPASFEAHLLIAQLELAQVRRLQDKGAPPDAWMSLLEDARSHLKVAGQETSLATDVNEAQMKIEQLAARAQPEAPNLQPAHPSPKPAGETKRLSTEQIDLLLRESQHLLEATGDEPTQNRNRDLAEKHVDQVLKSQPDNQVAIKLRDIIRRLKI